MNFFSSKVPEFLHVLFPDKRRANRRKTQREKFKIWTETLKKVIHCVLSHAFITCTTIHTNKGAKNLKNGFLLFHLVVLIVHASIFSPRFSQKQSAKHNSGMGTAWGVTWKHWPPVHGPPTDRSTDPFYGPPPTHPCYGPPQKIAEKENKQI